MTDTNKPTKVKLNPGQKLDPKTGLVIGRSPALARAKASITIFITAIIVLIVGIIQDIKKGRAFRSDIIARRFLGFFVATLLLLMLAQLAPKLAQAFAITMAVAVVIADSGEVFASVRKGLAPNIALDARNYVSPDRKDVVFGGGGGFDGGGGSSW